MLNAEVAFDHLEYVDLGAWPEFESLVARGLVDLVECACRQQHRFPSQVVVYLAERKLLVYVTQTGDSAQLDTEFRQKIMRLGLVNSNLPYTFVHGWLGLDALLRAFNTPYEGSTGDHSASMRNLVKVHGYQYGSLFFWEPAQVAVGEAVQALLELGASTRNSREADLALRIFFDFIGLLGWENAWLTQEIGRLQLLAGRLDQAEQWLERAVALEHRWLACTREFEDAMADKRGGKRSQDERLPHTNGAAVRHDVRHQRHVVLIQRPAVRTDDLLYFPLAEQAVVPASYSFHTALAAQGLAHGHIERTAVEGHIDLPWHCLPPLRAQMWALLTHLSRRNQAHSTSYLEGYVLGRWDVALGPFNTTGTLSRGLGRGLISAALSDLERLVRQGSPPGQDDRFLTAFADEVRSLLVRAEPQPGAQRDETARPPAPDDGWRQPFP